MKDYTKKNKKAWEFDAYNFWIEQSGKPEERAKRDVENPKGMLKRYAVERRIATGINDDLFYGSNSF